MAILWCLVHLWWVTDYEMPTNAVIPHARLQGFIASIPSQSKNKTQFQLDVKSLNGKPVKSTVLLSCYQRCPTFHPGEFWELTAKLKKPHNLGNPGSFNYAGLLFARHITWTGYVRQGSFKKLTTKNPYPLLGLRERLSNKLALIFSDEKTLGIVQALTLGITTQIDKEEWELFRRTGTVHLMVISGAHIGLIAGLTFGLVKWCWRRSAWLCLRYPAPKVASLAALFMAALYALLAGFAVPAQRALVVSFFMLLRYFCNQRFSAWQAWRYALLAVLFFEPHSVLMSGFYLSFIAVAILLLMNQRFSFKGIRKTMVMQLACLSGLMPLTLFWFSYGSLNGMAANLLAIPLVSFIIVPMSLFVTLISQWVVFSWAAWLLKISISILLSYLNAIDSFAWINLHLSFTNIISPLAVMLALVTILLLPMPQLLPAILILAFAGVFPAVEKIKPGEARIDILDVGQGLAVLVQTAHHSLIYDTGMQFHKGSDMGKLVIIPYLRYLGLSELDTVVISHPDLDHRGGLASIAEQYKINTFIVDDPAFYGYGHSCHDYPSWEWEGVTFRFFALKEKVKGKNNRSCILQVATTNSQMLLTGDIEKVRENNLVSTYGKALKSSVLLVPHHGSKTSSSPLFLKEVSPVYAVVSYGFDNHYRFPHLLPMQEYKRQHIPVYSTEQCGMVSVILKGEKAVEVRCPSKTRPPSSRLIQWISSKNKQNRWVKI